MVRSRFSQPFVTEERIAFAVKLADELAAENHSLSGFECAERAVRKVFGRWLIDYTANVPAPRMPLYLRLVDEVEERLGLHRRRSWGPRPQDPAVARGLP